MTLIVDASALYAQADPGDPAHHAVSRTLREEPGALVTSELVAAEADYLILDRFGVDAELGFLDDLVAGTFAVECLARGDLQTARALVERYRDLRIGLADASLAVLAQRHRTRRVLTLDNRCFRAMTPLQGGRFTVLPADDSLA